MHALTLDTQNNNAPPAQLIPSELALALSEPLRRTTEDDVTYMVVSLQDSAFHRLLLHATCQFYGLKSKSRICSCYVFVCLFVCLFWLQKGIDDV